MVTLETVAVPELTSARRGQNEVDSPEMGLTERDHPMQAWHCAQIQSPTY